MAGFVMAMLVGFLGLVHPTIAAELSCAAGDVACLITAIRTANGDGDINTITLAAGLYPLTAVEHDADGPTGLPSVTGALTLRGPGTESTVLERAGGAPPFRLLHVAATGVLTLEGLTLRGGELADLPGGGIYTRGTLTLTDSTLSGHTAREGGGLYHSGEDSTGTLTLTRSTVSGNVAHGSGGGIYASAPLTLTHSTVHGNVAHGNGGGISLALSTLTLTHSTLSGNTASEGGGLYISIGGIAPPGHAILGNIILAGNTVSRTGRGPDCAGGGEATSQGHNLLGEPTPAGCDITLAVTDLTGDPGLGDFTDDGTPGRGHVPLLPASPARETGDAATCPPTDQLGQSRVGACDIGAVEFQPPPDADVVTIGQAVFVEGLALLAVTATSTAAPAATLFVTVPGCWVHGAMARVGGRYVHLHADPTCGVLTGRTVVVTSSHGGAVSAPLR
jgi:predicted outer membrane repeat protein